MRGIIVALAGFALVVGPAEAQETAQETKHWSARTELGASVFFGNTSQSAVTTSLAGEADKGLFDLAGRAGFVYSEASDADGETFVNKRAWDAGLDINYDPGTALNGFVRGKVESIFEKKIELRYNAGLGGRYQLASGGGTESEFSLAILAERTIPREGAGVEEGVVAKWAARFKLTKKASDGRVGFESDTTFEPEVADFGVYTLTSRNSIAFQLNSRIAAQLSLIDAYDSAAKARGARSNNDGQIFVSLVATF